MQRPSTQVIRYSAAAAVVWTLIVGGSLLWNTSNEKRQTHELALNAARANFNKDQAYRLWASSHGGVYVEPTVRTPPSPYMAHIPDRDVVTTGGKRLTLMNPAYMLREMMQDFSDLYGIKGKITGKVVLNPVNTPDAWELKALAEFERGVPEVMEMAEVGREPYLRVMRPMVMREDCLKCHGHLGFKVGDIRGGVGIAVPMLPYLAVQEQAIRTMWATHGGIWLLGLAGIGAISRRSLIRTLERARNVDELRLAAKVFENGLDGIVITDTNGTIVRANGAFSEITGYPPQELLGSNTRILRSQHHRTPFYTALWQTLLATGRWQGEIWNRRKGGETFVAWQNIAEVRDDLGRVSHYIGSMRDITRQKDAEARIQHLAHYDVLTELPNRTLLHDRIEHALDRARREGTPLALLFLDLDRFKTVNDTLGHLEGDRLLKLVATRLRGALRQGDTVARLGGDEFVVLLENIHGAGEVQVIAEKLLAALVQPAELSGGPLFTSTSIGISLFPADGDTPELLLRNADTAMYRAKDAGRNRFYFYDPAMSLAAARRLELETALRYSMERGELFLEYQPQIALRGGTVVAVEALLRWRYPANEVMLPGDFVQTAEETGLILPIGRYVLEQACTAAARWQRELTTPPRVAVNVSARQLWDADFPATVAQVLNDTGLRPASLDLELTESFLMTHSEEAIAVLEELKGLGISLSIDDFGTGYSSFSYLKRLPVDRLKVDKSFIAHVATDGKDAAITEAIISLSRSLRIEVVAEGIETHAHLAFLARHHCDLAQGFFICRPLAREAVAGYVERCAAS